MSTYQWVGVFLMVMASFPVFCAIVYGAILDKSAENMDEEKRISAQGAVILTIMVYCFAAGTALFLMN